MQDLKDNACIYIMLKAIQTKLTVFLNYVTMVVSVWFIIKNLKCLFVE
jgi:hypothetical protein